MQCDADRILSFSSFFLEQTTAPFFVKFVAFVLNVQDLLSSLVQQLTALSWVARDLSRQCHHGNPVTYSLITSASTRYLKLSSQCNEAGFPHAIFVSACKPGSRHPS